MSEASKKNVPSSGSNMVEIKYKKINVNDIKFDQGDTVSRICLV